MILTISRIFTIIILLGFSQMSFASVPLFVAGVESAGTPPSGASASFIKEIDTTTLSELQLDNVESITVTYNGTSTTFEKKKRFLMSENAHSTNAASTTYFRWKGKTIDNQKLIITIKDDEVSGRIVTDSNKIEISPTANPNEVELSVYEL